MFGRKQKKRTEADLRAKFIKLGVDEPEFCVEDELDDKSNPRLAPLVLFHNIWQGVLRKGDTEWITETIDHFESRKNLQGVASAMWPEEQELLDALNAVAKSGIDLEHITTLARRSQEHLLYHVAYTLSDSHSDEEEFEDVRWAVFETDKDENPLKKMNVLHEYYELVDPDRSTGE
jgi:hypothetical protein